MCQNVVSAFICGAGSPASRSAVGGSVATTTALASISWSSVRTDDHDSARTRVFSLTVPAGRLAASNSGNLPMPSEGTDGEPSTKERISKRGQRR